MSLLPTRRLIYSSFSKKIKKQAYNIGIKAAKNDWLIFANASHAPVNETILQAINDSLDDTADLTLGYLTKKGIKLQSFYDVDDASDHITRIERRLKKVRTRKRNHYRWGRYDFIVIKKSGLRCAEVLRAQAIVCSASGFALAHFLEKPVLQI